MPLTVRNVAPSLTVILGEHLVSYISSKFSSVQKERASGRNGDRNWCRRVLWLQSLESVFRMTNPVIAETETCKLTSHQQLHMSKK